MIALPIITSMKTPKTTILSIVATTYVVSHAVGLLVDLISSPQYSPTILCAETASEKTSRVWCTVIICTIITVVGRAIQASRKSEAEKNKAAEEERQRLAAQQAVQQAEENKRREEERRKSLCPQCGGGGKTGDGQICPTCDGSGMRKIEVCPTCSGRGVNAAGSACPRCGGRGQYYLN